MAEVVREHQCGECVVRVRALLLSARRRLADADRLNAVEASSGGQRRAPGYLGEVLVEEHSGDKFLARSDADLFVEALGVVLDRVRREDQRFGDLDARQPACEERGDLTLAGGGAERLQRTVAERAALARSTTIATRPSDAEPGLDACRVTQPSSAGTVTTFAPRWAA